MAEFESLENAQPAQSSESTSNPPEAEASSDAQAISKAPRLFVNEDRMWQAITGHSVDPKKVPRHEFIILSIIAAHGEEGVVQPEITRISGQDKRSVPRRTDNLQKNGYITKTHVLAKGTRTSRCTLKKFAKAQVERRKALPKVDYSSPPELIREVIFEGGLLIYDRFFDVLMDILKQCTIITFDDCKTKLGIKTKTWEMKSLWRSMRRLEGLGLVKKCKAQIKGMVTTQKWYRCIKLTRQPTPRDRVVFVTMSMRAANKIKNELAEAGGDEDAEHEVDMVEEEEQDGAEAGPQAPLAADNDVEEIVRLPPQWDPDRPLTNLFWEVIDESGPGGTTTSIIRSKALGAFYKRPVDSMLGRISDIWHISQPRHLRHFAVVRDTGISGKYIHYIYRSFANFQIAVDAGEAAWEVVVTEPSNPNISKVKPRAKGGKHIREKAQTDYGPMNEWGFPQIAPSAFLGQHGTATLEDSHAAILGSGIKSLPSRGYVPRFILNGYSVGARLPDSDDDGDSSFTGSPKAKKSKPRAKLTPRMKKPAARAPLLKRATTYAQAQRDSQHTPEAQGSTEIAGTHPSSTGRSPSSSPRRPRSGAALEEGMASPSISSGKRYRIKAKAEKAAPLELWEEGKKARGLGLSDPIPLSGDSTAEQDTPMADAPPISTEAEAEGNNAESNPADDAQQAQDEKNLTGRQRHKLRLEAEKAKQAEEAKRRQRELELMGIDSFAIAERADIIFHRMLEEEEQALQAAEKTSQPGVYINPPGSQKPRDPLKRGRPKKALVAVIVLPALRDAGVDSSEFAEKVEAARSRSAQTISQKPVGESPPPSPRPHQSSKRPKLYTPAEISTSGTALEENTPSTREPSASTEDQRTARNDSHPVDSPKTSSSIPNTIRHQPSIPPTPNASHANTPRPQETPPVFLLLDEIDSGTPEQLKAAYDRPLVPSAASMSPKPASSPSKSTGTLPKDPQPSKKRGRPRKNPETPARPRKAAKKNQDDTPAEATPHDSSVAPNDSPAAPSATSTQAASQQPTGIANVDPEAKAPESTSMPQPPQQASPKQASTPAPPVQNDQRALESYFSREKPESTRYQSPYAIPAAGNPRHQTQYSSKSRTSTSTQGVYRSPYAPTGVQTPLMQSGTRSAAITQTAHPAPGPVAGQFSDKPRATPLQTPGWTSINAPPRPDAQPEQHKSSPAKDGQDRRASANSNHQSQSMHEPQNSSETEDEVFERIPDAFSPRNSRKPARKTSLSNQKSPAKKSPAKKAVATENESSQREIHEVPRPFVQKTAQKATSTGEEDGQRGSGGDEDTEMQDAPSIHEDTETLGRSARADRSQNGDYDASLAAQASEPVPEEPGTVEQEPKWTGPTLRKGKERAANEPFINPNPSEVPIKHKKGRWQQGRKQGVKLGSGGILNFNRSKLLCDILEKCNGVFPGDFEIQRPFIGLWKKEHGADRLVDRDTVKRTIKNAVDTGKIRRLTYTFKDKKGVLVSRHILTLPDVDPKSPLVLETQRKVIEAMPRVYWPPEMKHYEDELGNSWYGERYERETELQVQRESLPKWMRDTQLKSAEDHKRREADLKRSLQKDTRGPPRPRGSTRGRARGGTLRGRATGRMRLAGLPRPRSGSDAGQPWSAVDTTFHARPGSAHGLPEMSELPQFMPAERRGSFMDFQTDNFVIEDPSASYEGYSDDDSTYSIPGTPRGRRGSVSSIASSVTTTPRRRGSLADSSIESPRRAKNRRKSRDSSPGLFVSPYSSRRSSLAGLDAPSRPGTPSTGWCNIGPGFYDPAWEIQQIATLTDPDQLFNPSNGTFSTEYVVTRNARLSCWTPAHRVPREDYQRQLENMIPRSLDDLKKQAKMKGKQRNHSRRENPYLSMLEREILEIRSWERSSKPVDRDSVYAKYRVREPHFINHNFYGEHITPDFDMSSTPMFTDYWSEHYTIDEPPPLDVDEDEDGIEPFIPVHIPVGPPPAKRFRRKTVVNTPDTRPIRPLVRKIASATSSRNPFADPDCIITTADTKKLLYTMVVVQSLIGGLDNTTSWEAVRRVFEEHPRWDYPAFRNRWTWLRMHCAHVMDKLFEDFQKAFLLAYECGDVPSLNYKRPHDYDWPYIVEWAMQNISVKPPREIDPNSDLPASREELDERFIIEEITDRVDPPKETLFNEATLAARRKELYSEYSFYIPLTVPEDPMPNPKRMGFSEAAIGKAKSWVRATIVAPNHMFNAAAAKEILCRLNDKLIEKATNDLIGSKWFRNEHKGRGNRPGRQYTIDKNFTKVFERQLQAPHLIDAMRFKAELDAAFSNGAEAYPVRGAANDGVVLATINLLNSGHVKFVPRLPEVNHTVGAPFPRLTKFGFTEGHYKTVQMDRTRTHWDIDIVPTERYIYGNPLLKAKEMTELPQKLPLPAQGSAFEDWIPIWYSIQLAPIREWWCRFVAGVLHVIFGRPGIGAQGIRRAFKEAIGEWEVELCLAWMKEMGVIEEMRLGLDENEATRGWRLGEWWWCCLGPEAMMETA